MKLALLLMLCLPAWPQATVMFKPTLVYGKRQIWTVTITSDAPVAQAFARESITQLAPSISEYPNDIAQDVLIRAASKNAATIGSRLWAVLSPPAGAALNGLAIAKKTNGPLYISAGISAIDLGIALFASRAPQPQKYFNDLLPATVGLGPHAGASYGIVANPAKDPQPLGPFHLGGAAPPGAAELDAPVTSPDLAAERLEKILRARGLSDVEILAMVSR